MGKYSRLGKNTLLVFMGNVGSRLISFVMLPLYTEWLSTEDYGTIDLINIYIVFLASIITCCLAEAIFRFPKDQERCRQTSYFSTGLVVAIILFILAGGIFYLLKSVSSNSTDVFFLHTDHIYILILVTFLQSYFQQFTRSIDKMGIYVSSGVVLALLVAVFSILLMPTYGLLGCIWAQIIAIALGMIYTFVAAKLHLYFSLFTFNVAIAKEMLWYSMPLIPNSFIWWVLNSSNRFFIEKYQGLESVGLFAVSNKFPSMIAIVSNMFFLSWQISVIEEFKKEGYKDFYNKMFRLITILSLLLTVVVTVSSYWLVRIMANEEFLDSWVYIPLLSLAVPLASLSGFVGANFLAVKKSKYYFISSVWAAVICIILNFLLIPQWGLWGASVSIVISSFVMLIFRIYYSEQYVSIDRKWRSLFSFLLVIFIALSVPLEQVSVTVRAIFITVLSLLLCYCSKDVLSDMNTLKILLKNRVRKK